MKLVNRVALGSRAAYPRSVPRGPKGERRPADVIGNAVHVMRIATGEAEDVKTTPDPAKEHMRRGGLKGGASQETVEGPAERHRQESGPDAPGQGRPEC